MDVNGTDVAEVYSVPRMTAMAPMLNLSPGFALDLNTPKDNGEPWDLSHDSNVNEAPAMIYQDDVYFLVGSPPCAPPSIINKHLNYQKMAL